MKLTKTVLSADIENNRLSSAAILTRNTGAL
jgi:hypothetical protein